MSLFNFFSISGSSADDEEDFYYTEIELDSPLDSSSSSSGISSAGHSIEPLSPSPHCCENCGCHASNVRFNSRSSPLQSTLKASPSTWMHLDMARPAHEDPEYRQRLARTVQLQPNNHGNSVFRRRPGRKPNSLKFTSGASSNALLSQMSANQLAALQQQNAMHLQHNLQHLQASLANRHKRNRKASSQSTIMATVAAQNAYDQLPLTFELQPVPVKRSKPIQVPALAAHRRPKSPNSLCSPFTVGSVQNSPRSYFHCISPSSLGSPSGSSCSSTSAASFSSLCSVAAAASVETDLPSSVAKTATIPIPKTTTANLLSMSGTAAYAPNEHLMDHILRPMQPMQHAVEAIETEHLLQSLESYDSAFGCEATMLPDQDVEIQPPDVQAELELQTPENHQAVGEGEIGGEIDEVEEASELFIDTGEDDNLDELLDTPQFSLNVGQSSLSTFPADEQPTDLTTGPRGLFVDEESDALTKLAESAVHALVNVKRAQQLAAAEQSQQPQQMVQQLDEHQQHVFENFEFEDQNGQNFDNDLIGDHDNKEKHIKKPSHSNRHSVLKRADYEALLTDHQYRHRQQVPVQVHHRKISPSAITNVRFTSSRLPRMAGRPARYEQAVRRAYERRYSFTPCKIGSSNTMKLSSRRPVGRPPKPTLSYNTDISGRTSSVVITAASPSTSVNASGVHARRPPGRPKGSGKTSKLIRQTSQSQEDSSDLNTSFESYSSGVLGSSAEVESLDSGLGGSASVSDVFASTLLQRHGNLPITAASAVRLKNSAAKCRKKFGMENKHQWCTQCKWKKACSRVAAAVAAATSASATLPATEMNSRVQHVVSTAI